MDRGFVAFVVPLGASGPGFAIPILKAGPQSNALYRQSVDHRGRVAALEPCHSNLGQLRPTAPPHATVSVGDLQVHALISPAGEVIVGTRDVLASNVRDWIDQALHPLTQLALADFAGDALRAHIASQDMFRQMTERAGQDAGRQWFLDAVVAPRVVRAVLNAVTQVKDIRVVDDLVERISLDAKGGDLRIDLPSALIDDFGVRFEQDGSALNALIGMAKPLGVNRAVVLARDTPKPRVTKRPGRREAAILVVGDEALFRRLTETNPGEEPHRVRSQRHLLLVTRPDDTVVGFVNTTEGLGLSLTALLAGRAHIAETLVVLSDGLDRHVVGADLNQWRAGQADAPAITLALRFKDVSVDHISLEQELAARNPDRAVLSLANAWNPRLPAKGGTGSAGRVAECLEGWIAAARSGDLRSLRSAKGLSDGVVFSTATLSLRRGDPVGPALLAVANPLRPDVSGARAVIRWVSGRPHTAQKLPDHAEARGRYLSVEIDDGARRPDRSATVSAVAAAPAFSKRGDFDLDSYVGERLASFGWTITRGRGTADIVATMEGLPPTLISVMRTAADAWHKPSLTGDGQWHAFVVGETLAPAKRRRPKEILAFDQLDTLERIVREHALEIARPAQLRQTSVVGADAFLGARVPAAFILAPDVATECLRQDSGHHRDLMVPVLSGRDLAQFPQLGWTFDLWDDPRDYPSWVFDTLRERATGALPQRAFPRMPGRIRHLETQPRYLTTPVSGSHRFFVRCSGPIAVTSTVVVFPNDPDWLLALFSSKAHTIWARTVGVSMRGDIRYSRDVASTFPLPVGLEEGRAQTLAHELAGLGDELSHRRLDWQFEGMERPNGVLEAEFLRRLTLEMTEDERRRCSRERTLKRLYDENPPWLAEIQDAIDRAVFSAYGLASSPTSGDVVDRLLDLNRSGGDERWPDAEG